MNKLTEYLNKQGYSKENHPNYVKWSSWQDFEYTREYLMQTVWETPCGLLQKGIDSYNHGSHRGIDYCPENDNPRFGCPYYDEVPCPHRFNENMIWGWNCIYHQTDRTYDYESSVEKLWDYWDKIEHQAYMELLQGFPEGVSYCRNFTWNRYERKFKARFNIDFCISWQCANPVCAVTGKTRNTEKVNIFYDLVFISDHKQAFLCENGNTSFAKTRINKDNKVFKKNIARSDAEIWLKLNEKSYFAIDTEFDCYRIIRRNAKDLLNHCQDIRYQNIRIQKRENRDLLSDLQDVQNGITINHVSDLKKAAVAQKRERKTKRLQNKSRRAERMNIQKWLSWIQDDTVSEVLKRHAVKELTNRKIDYSTILENQYAEQINLFI